jgi:hypothetical protein
MTFLPFSLSPPLESTNFILSFVCRISYLPSLYLKIDEQSEIYLLSLVGEIVCSCYARMQLTE